MAVNTVNFTINLNGNAYNGIVNMNAAFGNFNSADAAAVPNALGASELKLLVFELGH